MRLFMPNGSSYFFKRNNVTIIVCMGIISKINIQYSITPKMQDYLPKITRRTLLYIFCKMPSWDLPFIRTMCE